MPGDSDGFWDDMMTYNNYKYVIAEQKTCGQKVYHVVQINSLNTLVTMAASSHKHLYINSNKDAW